MRPTRRQVLAQNEETIIDTDPLRAADASDASDAGHRLAGADLVRLLAAPRSIAVVGASPDPDSYASKPIEFLRRYGFGGRMLAVNPRYRQVNGVTCLPGSASMAARRAPSCAPRCATCRCA